jgi:glycosyltransferase involved in cell wall biosynthesis
MMSAVVILRSNAVDPDPRVEKVARWLHEEGWKVTIIAWDRERSSPRIEKRPYALIHRIHIPGRYGAGFRNLLALLSWNLLLAVKLFITPRHFSHFHACDFDTILPAYLVGKLTRKRVVYDIFDFYADELLNRVPRPLVNCIRYIDFWIMGQIDAVIIVDDLRRAQIQGALPKQLEVIYNVPEPIEDIEYGKNLSHPYKICIAHVGILQKERGLLEAIEVMARHPEWHLILGGFGGDEELIKEKAKKNPNVRFVGRIPYHETLRIYSDSDIILATYDPTIPNHRYSSPNKLFEAMMLGKPIVVARGTGVDKTVERFNLGFVVDYGNLHQLEKVFAEVESWNALRKEDFALRSKAVYDQFFSARTMRKRLLNLYNRIGREVKL